MNEKDIDAFEFDSWEFFNSATVEDVRNRLAAGCDPNARDESGSTPLSTAVGATKDPEVIVAMLDAGGDALSRSNSGGTPLHSAALMSEEPRVLELLLEAGANPNARSDSGWTPLHGAAERSKGNLMIIKTLLGAGANPNVIDEWQYTPLLSAASHCEDPAVVEALIEGGADPNLRGVNGLSPLQMALDCNIMVWADTFGKWSIPEVLIRRGADPNLQNSYGHTALHTAARNCRVATIFEVLIEGGADMHIRDEDGKTPLRSVSHKKDKPDTVAFLKAVESIQKLRMTQSSDSGSESRSAEPKRKFEMATFFRLASVEDVISFLRAGGDPNACFENGQTVLYHAAAATTDPAVIYTLIDAGAEVNSRTDCGNTPLHEAARVNVTPAVLEALIAVGADPNARNRIDATPMHKAAGRIPDSPSTIEILAKAGADPNVLTVDRYTPLLIAAANCREPAVIDALAKAGADPNIQGKSDRTPLHFALQFNTYAMNEYGNSDIAEALIRAGSNLSLRTDSDETVLWRLNVEFPELVKELNLAGA